MKTREEYVEHMRAVRAECSDMNDREFNERVGILYLKYKEKATYWHRISMILAVLLAWVVL